MKRVLARTHEDMPLLPRSARDREGALIVNAVARWEYRGGSTLRVLVKRTHFWNG